MRAQQEVGFIWRAAGTWLNFDQLLGSTSPFSISGQWTLPPTGAEPDILATSFIFVLEREEGGHISYYSVIIEVTMRTMHTAQKEL